MIFVCVSFCFQIKRNDVVSLISHTENSSLFCFVSDGASSSCGTAAETET